MFLADFANSNMTNEKGANFEMLADFIRDEANATVILIDTNSPLYNQQK